MTSKNEPWRAYRPQSHNANVHEAYERVCSVEDVEELCTECNGHLDRARKLLADMWNHAQDWTGPAALSHYRSDVAQRLRDAGVEV